MIAFERAVGNAIPDVVGIHAAVNHVGARSGARVQNTLMVIELGAIVPACFARSRAGLATTRGGVAL
jgi:hypothetical protein